jgi:hypothetical protein
MNATPYHSKVRLTVTLSDKFYIAGDAITGKMELESRADTGLGLGIIAVELVAIEGRPFQSLLCSYCQTHLPPELTSRDHSATSTFIHTRRLYQGPGLPPSNAVLPNPIAGEPPLPAHYHQARRGLTTFLFRLPLPPSSPPSIDFGNGLARIRYEARGSVGVCWKNQNRLVTSQCPVDVLQQYPGDDTALEEDGLHTWPAPECLVIGEGGKIWAQARVVGGMLVAGESACVELQVKNHSSKKVRPVSSLPRFCFLLTRLCIDDGFAYHALPAPAPALANPWRRQKGATTATDLGHPRKHHISWPRVHGQPGNRGYRPTCIRRPTYRPHRLGTSSTRC